MFFCLICFYFIYPQEYVAPCVDCCAFVACAPGKLINIFSSEVKVMDEAAHLEADMFLKTIDLGLSEDWQEC